MCTSPSRSRSICRNLAQESILVSIKLSTSQNRTYKINLPKNKRESRNHVSQRVELFKTIQISSQDSSWKIRVQNQSSNKYEYFFFESLFYIYSPPRKTIASKINLSQFYVSFNIELCNKRVPPTVSRFVVETKNNFTIREVERGEM